jgi:HlyD family secretion protein
MSFDLASSEKRIFFPETQRGLPDILLPELKHINSQLAEQERVRVGEEALDRLVEIRDLQAELELLRARLERDSVVRSRYDGTVVEVKLGRNEVLKSGASLALLEVTPEDLAKRRPEIMVKDDTGRLTAPQYDDLRLRVIAFLPAATAKKAEKGDPVRIQPGYLDRKAFGYMLGEVTWVSNYPATEERMKRLLRNPTVVQEMQQTGTILEFHIDLKLDGQGQQIWKSLWNAAPFRAVGSQDPAQVSSGTLCAVEVEVKKRRPIGLVFPIFE